MHPLTRINVMIELNSFGAQPWGLMDTNNMNVVNGQSRKRASDIEFKLTSAHQCSFSLFFILFYLFFIYF